MKKFLILTGLLFTLFLVSCEQSDEDTIFETISTGDDGQVEPTREDDNG